MKNRSRYLAITAAALISQMGHALAGPLCALAPPGHSPLSDQPPTPVAYNMMQSISSVLCPRFSCPDYLLIRNSTISNAMALVNMTGYSIRYNPRFMNGIIQSFGRYAAAGIFAHEIGHIIDFWKNPNPGVPQWQREATADEYAGCAFALAGHRRADLVGLAKSLHSMGPSPGYPTPDERVWLVQQGYLKCSE